MKYVCFGYLDVKRWEARSQGERNDMIELEWTPWTVSLPAATGLRIDHVPTASTPWMGFDHMLP